MLTIDSETIQTLRDAAVRRYEQDLVAHVRTFFPNHYRLAGTDGVASLAQLAITRARSCGITSERGVCLFLNTMLLLGSFFNQDPQFRWVASILTGGHAEADYRAATLAERAKDWFTIVAGLNNRALNRTLVQVHQDSEKVFRYPVQGEPMAHLVALLRWISPTKCDLLGAQTLQTLILDADARAPALRLVTAYGRTCHVAFSFMLGIGYYQDPLHDWARATLDGDLVGEARVAHLHTAALAALGDFLAHA